MTNKTEMRSNLSADIEAFLKSGGKIETVKSIKRKVRHEASGHQKLWFGWQQPRNRPTNSWDLIETKEK